MDIKKYIFSHCINPQSVEVYDARLMQFVSKELPCGRCLHCRNTRVNEWVTRLYAQSLYSSFVYYITLDYAPFDINNADALNLCLETAGRYHNINSLCTYGYHPILLRKNHLQDFFKRFRRNNPGIKIQYFACGEYGTHANGRGYARPHFHIIVYSNSPITHDMFVDAWTINGYTIGRVDYNDLRANGSFDDNNINSNNNSKFVFSYVCKYLQKTDFEFEKLATIDFHRAFYHAITFAASCSDFTPAERSGISIERLYDYSWKDYVTDFSPFIVCSKRPAIGYQYFKENVQRFAKGDFKLFGLSSDDCKVFPSYYRRKTKEALCDFVAVGETTDVPSTCSRIGYIKTVLSSLLSSPVVSENNHILSSEFWCRNVRKDIGHEKQVVIEHWNGGKYLGYVPFKSLHVYDKCTKVFFQFNGYYYTLWQKVNKLGYVRLSNCSLKNVHDILSKSWDNYLNKYLEPMHDLSVISECMLSDTLTSIFGDTIDKYERFKELVSSYYTTELSSMYKRNLLIQNSKTSF